MKGKRFAMALVALGVFAGGSSKVQGQAVITFNDPWVNNGVGGFVLDYYEGFSFRVVPPHPPPVEIDEIKNIGAIGPSGYPHNGTPFAAFINTLGTGQYVLFARTNAARFGDYRFTWGAPFGLVSVDLADPIAPSPDPIEVVFNGFRADGSMVRQSFIVGGGGSSVFQTFYFGPAFAHGLVRVEIPSGRWAMDNVVWVPEPGVCGLFGVGLLGWWWRRVLRRRAV